MNVLDFRDGKWLDNPDTRCDECGKGSVFLVSFGEGDCENRVCEFCIRDAWDEIAAMRREPA